MEEAPVAVTAATGALGPVVAKLSTLLQRRHGEYKLRRGTRKDLKLIRSKLMSIHSILWAIWEEEDLDAAGKELRMEAWRLADDMNDAVDDFILSLKCSSYNGKRFVQAKNQPSPFQDLRARADDVSERCRKKWKMKTSHTTFSCLFSTTKTAVDDCGPGNKRRTRVVDPYVHKDISKLVEMEEPRDELIDHLVGEGENRPQLKMACILGAAGMGKTTLARLVYEAIQDKFQARAFVSVTSSQSMTEVLASIYQQLQGIAHSAVVQLAGTKAATAEQHLIDDISNFLQDKRYLVIIDDIWYCREWENIKKSLPDNNLGSRIVTTSRVKSVTEKWRDDFGALVYKLIRNQSTEMIVRKSAGGMDGPGFDLQHPIVKMCADMPLAVACMISALAKQRERREQQGLPALGTHALQDEILKQVMGNGIQCTPGFEPLVESLELGYRDLPHHMLKTCLLYCSIYPEGHLLDRDELIRRWIAEGFACMEAAAKDYFDELVSRGFFQEFIVDSNYKLHPMMRNYLRWKLRGDNFMTCTSDGVPSSGRLCIDDNWPSSDAAVYPLSGIDWHHIRSLVVFKDAERVPYRHLENLRVLDAQPNEVLENQHLKDMCGLLRLRLLSVSGRLDITEIPAEIARLQYLETLEVRKTGITGLPAEIGGLKQLKTLDLSMNNMLAELPREMENLQHVLETLRIHESSIREQAWEIIGTLKKLKTLDVSRNLGIRKLPKEIGKLQHLETLNLKETRIAELPREIFNLQWLKALLSSKIHTLPPDIGRLQHLETLDLGGAVVSKMPREIGGLKKLKNLDAFFAALPFEAGQLSKLQGLPRCVREAWKNSDLVSSLAREILSFETTGSISIGDGDGGLIVGSKHMHIPPWIKEHFNNIRTLDIRICKLEDQDLRILREMPSLKKLTLRFEGVLREPVTISSSSGGFTMLHFLTVDSRAPRIIFQEGAMPSLRAVTFEFQFYGGGPPNKDPPMGIKHLLNLRRVSFECNRWYRGGDRTCISATIEVMRKEAREHPNKITVTVSGKKDEIFPENRIVITQSSQDRSEARSSSGGEETVETQ